MTMSSLPVSSSPAAFWPLPENAPGSCTIVVAEQEVIVPPSAHTLQGFRAWAKSDAFPRRGRISFLNGEIVVNMSPEELETHVKVKMEIGYGLMGWTKKKKRGTYYGDGTLVTNGAARLSTQPDGTFVTWESLESGRVRLVPREGEQGEYVEVEGTPDWVLEVVSKYSVRKDTQQLREQYARARIPEYWLVDARGDDLRFQILVLGDGGYVAAETKDGWQRSIVFGCWVRLVRQRNEHQLWEYTLEMKPMRHSPR
jgi:Uma2 family endonuclease